MKLLLGSVGVATASAGWPAMAHADDPTPERLTGLEVRAAARPEVPARLRLGSAWDERTAGFDLRWSQFALTENPWGRDRIGPRLVDPQFQDDGLALGMAGVFSSLGTAFGGMLSKGLPLVDRTSAWWLPHRQFLGVYFRARGAVVAWRIDF